MDEINLRTPIEGFLSTFGENRYGIIYCHTLFCVLRGRHFSQYKSKGDERPIRSGILDADIRLEDSGRKIINGETLYSLRLYSLVHPSKERYMGSSRSEETAAWIKSFQLALQLPILVDEFVNPDDFQTASGFPLSGEDSPVYAKSSLRTNPDFASLYSSINSIKGSYQHLTTIGDTDPPPSQTSSSTKKKSVFQPEDESNAAKWRLVRCSNGLRFFEEINEDVIKYKFYKLPVMKCVGVVKSEPSSIFDLVMSFGSERLQWDATIDSGEILETQDGHSDVIYMRLRQDWIWLRKRNLCLSRYWIREEDGSYLVFFKSVDHPLCPKERNSVRAIVHSGGYIISPLKSSSSGQPRTLVEHVLEMDVSGWSSWFGIVLSPYPAFVRDSLLTNVAGIRDHFAAQRAVGSLRVVQWRVVEVQDGFAPAGEDLAGTSVGVAGTANDGAAAPGIPAVSFLDTEDVDEEFFDAYDDQPELETDSTDLRTIRVDVQPDLLTGDLPVEKITFSKLSPVDWSQFPGTVNTGPLLNGVDCWSRPDGNFCRLKGLSFFQDSALAPASSPLCHLVAVDWFQDEKKMDHLASRPQNIIRRVCSRYGKSAPFFFVINMQVPGTKHFSLVYYFEVAAGSESNALLSSFVNGDDVFRNARISLIPSIAEGNWIVKQAAGSRPVPIGQVMEVHYFSGEKYLEIDVNMGSSSIVRGVMGLVFGYITNLVVDMAFVIRALNQEELPERILGVVRCSHLSLNSAVPPMPE